MTPGFRLRRTTWFDRSLRPQHAGDDAEWQRARHAARRIVGHGGQSFDYASLKLPAVQPSRVAVIGARVTDPGERALIASLGLGEHTMSKSELGGSGAELAEGLGSLLAS